MGGMGVRQSSSLTGFKNGKQFLRFTNTGERPLEEAYSRHSMLIGKKKGEKLESTIQKDASDDGTDDAQITQ
jgi:hypothetical protein